MTRVMTQAYPLYAVRGEDRWLIVGWENSPGSGAWLPIMVDLRAKPDSVVGRSWLGQTVGEMDGLRMEVPE